MHVHYLAIVLYDDSSCTVYKKFEGEKFNALHI